MLKNKKLLCIYVCVFAYILFLTANCGFITDDYHFLFVWKDFEPQINDKPINGLSDILLSMTNYYNYSGGRIIAHFVAFVFININKWFFNIINSIVFVCLGILIRKLVYDRQKGIPLAQVIIYFSMLLFLPSFGDTVLWISGSVNYLWTSALLLYTVYFCKKHLDDSNRIYYIAMPILFFISSATNETTGGILLVWLTIHLITIRHKPDLKIVLSCITSVLGIMLVILAPGNHNRAALVEQTDVYNIKSFLTLLKNYLGWFLNDYKIIIVAFMISVIILYTCNKKNTIITSLPYCFAGLAGLSALTLTGFFSMRPTFFAVLFILVGTLKAAFDIGSIKQEKLSNRTIQRLIIIFICAFVVVIIYNFSYALLYLLGTAQVIYTYIPILLCTTCFILPHIKFRDQDIIPHYKADSLKAKLQKLFKAKSKIMYTSMIIIISSLLVYNAYDYYITMSDGKDFLYKRYESYITDGDTNVEDSMSYDNRYIPNEMFVSGDYCCKWITECYKYNIQKHELYEYYSIIKNDQASALRQNP